MKSALIGFLVTASLGLMACVNSSHSLSQESGATIIYLVRHTEKAQDGTKDPALTQAGEARAAYLASMLKEASVEKVLSTDFERTRETARPFAERASVSVELYDPAHFDVQAFAQSIVGGSAIIVGHSNTIPKIVNTLLGEDQFADQLESDYDSFFIVTIHGSAASAVRLHLPFPAIPDASR
jgi:broad specificity phosphatase PhoE